MGFFHVHIRRKTDLKWREVFLDLTEGDLKCKFINPFLKGKRISANNVFFEPTEFEAVKILKTVETNKQVRDRISAAYEDQRAKWADEGYFVIGSATGYDAAHIHEECEDVTDQYLKGKTPGDEGGRWKWLLEYSGLLPAMISSILAALALYFFLPK